MLVNINDSFSSHLIEKELYCGINQKNASLCQEYASHLGLGGGGSGPEDLGGEVFR